jgi:hypothetical protein
MKRLFLIISLTLFSTPVLSQVTTSCQDVDIAYNWVRCEHAESAISSIRKPQPGVECKILYDGAITHYIVNAELFNIHIQEMYTNTPTDLFVKLCEEPVPFS